MSTVHWPQPSDHGLRTDLRNPVPHLERNPTMVRSRARSIVAMLALAGVSSASPVFSAEPAPVDVLKDRGLARAGTLYVHKQEADVQKKFDEVRMRFEGFRFVFAQRMAIDDDAERTRSLDLHINNLRREIDNLNLELEQRPDRPNSVQAAYFTQRTEERDALRRTLNDEVAVVNTLRQTAPTLGALHELDTKVGEMREACRRPFIELRTLIDSTDAVYAALSRDSQVQAALAAATGRSAAKLKLGPSRDYRTIVARFAVLERSLQSPEKMNPSKPRVARKRILPAKRRG